MTHRSPLVTLIGLVAAFAIMFGVNLAASDTAAGPAEPAATPSAPAAGPSTGGPTTAAPATSVPPSPGPSTSASAAPSASASEPAGERFPDEVVYAGRTADGTIAVAVAVRGTKAAAYLCDGDSLESWLRGSVKGGDRVALRNKTGAVELEAELDDGRLAGEIDLDGDELEFTIAEARKPAGLYRARGAKTTVGWIVLPDGSQVGVQSTGQDTTAAPELDPDNPEVIVEDETLTGERVRGDQDV